MCHFKLGKDFWMLFFLSVILDGDGNRNVADAEYEY